MNSRLLFNSGAAGAYAGGDGITTAQKLCEGTENFDIQSDPIQSPNRTPPYPRHEMEINCQNLSDLFRKSQRKFRKNLRFFLNKTQKDDIGIVKIIKMQENLKVQNVGKFTNF